MKRLTKAFFKKEIKKNMKSGMTSLASMESLMNEFESYDIKIMQAHTEILIDGI